jgi:hypothetical protein
VRFHTCYHLIWGPPRHNSRPKEGSDVRHSRPEPQFLGNLTHALRAGAGGVRWVKRECGRRVHQKALTEGGRELTEAQTETKAGTSRNVANAGPAFAMKRDQSPFSPSGLDCSILRSNTAQIGGLSVDMT